MKRSMLAAALVCVLPLAFAGETPTSKEMEEARAQLKAAQTEMHGLSKKIAELAQKVGDVGPHAYAFRYMHDPERAMIGIVMEPGKDGVRIAGLTPDGPAQKAGLKVGDFIVEVNDVAVENGDVEKTESNSDGKVIKIVRHSGLKSAMSLLSDLKADEAVKLDVTRDGKPLSFALKAERREAWSWPRGLAMESIGKGMHYAFDDLDENIEIEIKRAMHGVGHDVDQAMRHAQVEVERVRHHLPWFGLRLSELNAELGRYFGADEGVLVLSVDKEKLPQLKAGDVLTDIAGKPVKDPHDAMRALRDQEPNAQFNVRVLRDRKPLVVALTAPEFKAIFITPPVPPTAPTAPLPPTPPAAPKAALPPPPPAPPGLPPAPPAAGRGGVMA